jgi:hypothetical protein
MLFNLEVKEIRREKLIRKGKRTQGVQLGSNENPVLPWLCQDCPEPAVEGTGVYILWDVILNQVVAHFLSSFP